MSRATPRAVVVGGGQNGLSAACTLAGKGWDVTVLERAGELGGAVKTRELTLPGFHHDVYSAVYPAAAASPVFRRWPLERHGLRFVHPIVAAAHPLDDGSAPALHRSLADTRASLDGFGDGDGRRWAEAMGPLVARFDALRGVMLGGFPPIAGGAKLLARLKLSGTLEFARLLLMPASGLADDLFESDAARAWLYGSALHGDAGPHSAGSAIAGAYLNLMGHAVGWPSPEGGAARLVDALVSYLRELGGTTRCDAPVERVVAQGGRAVGVELADGERIAADAVVCDLNPHGLARVAGDILPQATLRKYRRFRYGPGTLKVDWALDGPIPWAAPEARQAGTIHVGGSAAEIARAVAEVELGEWPERPFLLAGSQTVADPTRAPAGKHTAWAYTHTPGYGSAGQVEEQVARLEAQMERFAPGFSSRVLGRHVQSPRDIEAGTPNLVAGDVGAGSHALDQVVFRPVPSLSPYRTGVRGLYLGSASAFPGGAVHGVAGHAAARAAITDRRVRRVG
ncbi:NAD(P)/FAD-dependent oxidoreductase [Egibacter rhizosphaerae]|uniref:Pyridine nucleotide-disulfide oxidoreductase domain-containing protein 2 n=1 Tax=Egibacter rhizosphaerae TaxID=1670831 RepID=A0A411YHE3_9ACTN|nr:NAD(P)/FAD-dependent oxidoreductase [Egibacter rhizosphaerae]QBI20660.1 NAD(P)/FAD-dependent oxidoreductase [Egibacter rhizosphaerae]